MKTDVGAEVQNVSTGAGSKGRPCRIIEKPIRVMVSATSGCGLGNRRSPRFWRLGTNPLAKFDRKVKFMKNSKTPPEIEALSDEARGLYVKLSREWNITDGAGGVLLLTAMQSLDRLRQAQSILRAEGLIVKDRWGQRKAHPASTIEREARAGLLACLKGLSLDLESLEAESDAA